MLRALTYLYRAEDANAAPHQQPTAGLVAQNSNFNFDHFAAQDFLIRVGTIGDAPG